MALDVAMGGSTNTVLHILAAAQEGEVDFDLADIDAISPAGAVPGQGGAELRLPHGGRPPGRRHPGHPRRAATGPGCCTTGRAHGALAVARRTGSTRGTSAAAGAVRGGRGAVPRRAGRGAHHRAVLHREPLVRARHRRRRRLHPRRRARLHRATAGWPCCAATSPRTARSSRPPGIDEELWPSRARRGSSRARRRPSRRSWPSRSQPGDVVVVRYEGPSGGPGMQEMLHPTAFLKGAGLGRVCALITDGRFSGGSSGISIGHISPEAAAGGVIGLVEDGDRVVIDVPRAHAAARRRRRGAGRAPGQDGGVRAAVAAARPRPAGEQGPARLRRAGHERAHGGGPPGAVTGGAGDRREWHTTRLLTGVRCLSTRSHGGARSPQTRAGGGGRRDHLPDPGGAEVVGGEAEVLDVDVHVGPVGARAAPRTTAAGRRPGPAASPGRAPRGRRGRRPSRSGCRPGRCHGGRRRGRASAAGGPGSR